jgi:hypothetical protein
MKWHLHSSGILLGRRSLLAKFSWAGGEEQEGSEEFPGREKGSVHERKTADHDRNHEPEKIS